MRLLQHNLWQVLNSYMCRHTHAILKGFLKQGNSCWPHLWSWNTQNVPKRLHIKFRRRWITQKKEYSIQNKAEVWNQEGNISRDM